MKLSHYRLLAVSRQVLHFQSFTIRAEAPCHCLAHTCLGEWFAVWVEETLQLDRGGARWRVGEHSEACATVEGAAPRPFEFLDKALLSQQLEGQVLLRNGNLDVG